ncbi:BA75_00986T0 [Komagataella pastoris]|uniref:BA75_00986T0 n=1 Tax=Komagataella pastoris TaxID=4922 RepID=A0A1B2J9F6_PICPA|nr:BA75_00986T0 [Komagataella pastoris]
MSPTNFGFSPLETSIGALLIQFATTSYLIQVGKTVGFSSLIGNFNFNIDNSSLIIGLYLSYQFAKSLIPDFLPVHDPDVSSSTLVVAGLLVGVGSNLASGCTSGHMLAGLSRLRFRSLVATALFFVGGIFSTSFTPVKNGCRNRMGQTINCFQYDTSFEVFEQNKGVLLSLVFTGFTLTYFLLPLVSSCVKENALYSTVLRTVSGTITGFYFGTGLFISGMTSSDKVLGFLRVVDPISFDPSLALIVVFAVIPNIFIWRHILNQPKYPVLNDKWDLATSNDISKSLIIGSLTFGLGWGVVGACPGPGLLSFFVGKREWLIGFLIGYRTTKFLKPYLF